MGRYEAAVDVPIPVDDAFRLWTDPGRYPQWQVGVLRVFDVTGPADQVGTKLRLDFGPAMKRTTRVVESEPPYRYVVEEQGMKSRNRTATTFKSTIAGTRITVTYDLDVEMGPVSGILERMTRGQTLKTGRRELERFAALASRALVRPDPGDVYSVDGFAGYRIVKVIDADDEVVHLALVPGATKDRTDDVTEALNRVEHLGDPLSLKPLEPSLRRTASSAVIGQPLLALDGGYGVPHVAMAVGAFTDALPERIGSAPAFDDERSEVAAWRSTDGAVLGRDVDAAIVPLVSIPDDDQYAIGKLLVVERKGVHLRLYADRWDAPPDRINPWTLRLDRFDAPSMSYGHMPLSRRAFAGMGAVFHRLAMRSTSELEGYEMWREAESGFFD